MEQIISKSELKPKPEFEPEYVKVQYNCEYCEKNHIVKINKKLFVNAISFPISYLFVHSKPRIFTTLYIDANYKVRGSEILQGIGVGSDEFNKILNRSSLEILKIPREMILGFQLTQNGKILKIFHRKGYEGWFNFTEFIRMVK
ncbi:MAG: hypothetical protein ACTSWY_07075, partial [Promethearchaeota archaeon]